MSFPLASEIWLSIFNTLDRPKDVTNIVLTCRTFRWLAQPLLFKSLSVRPFSCNPFDHWESEQGYAKQQLERLSFISSYHIAHAVRTCVVGHSWMTGRSEPGDSQILMALFRLLPRFVNLKQLNCMFLSFTDNEWMQLCAVQRLQALRLEECSVPADIPLQTRPDIDHLTVIHHDYGKAYPDHSISTVNLSRIRSLQLSIMSRDDISAFLHYVHGMHSLQTLDILFSHASFACLLTALSNLTKLENLSVRSRFWDDGEFHTILTPVQLQPLTLKNYSGPYEILPLIIHDQKLRSMHLESFHEDGHADPATMLRVLFELREHFVDLESVTLFVNHLTDAYFMEMCSLLPSTLKVFSIFVGPSEGLDEEFHAEQQRLTFKDFLKSLAGRSIPVGTTKLLVRWTLEEKGPTPSDAEHVWLKNALLERCPELECIWLHSFRDNFFWKRGAGGPQYISHEHNPAHQSMFQT